MAVYHCEVADILTDQTVTELDLAVTTCQRRIVVPGNFNATLPITNLTTAEQARKIIAGRTLIHMYRDNDIWGTYPVWYAEPAMDEGGDITLQIAGATLESYLYRRKIRADLDYLGWDQLDIARALLTHMASRPEGDIGLVLDGLTSGVLRDRHYKASESAWYGQRLEELANVIDGFEYMIRTFRDPTTGQRIRQWVSGYPTLGNADATHIIEQPGRIKAWSLPEDATQAATAWQTRGDTIQDDLGTASQPLMSLAYEDAAKLGEGWPLLDQTVDYSTVREVATLNAYAQQLRDTRSGSVTVPKITVAFDDGFALDPNFLGDVAKFTLVNDWFPLTSDGAPTYDKTWRIVGMDLHTPTSDDQEVRAELIFQEAT
jgi:hypothetical protein